MRWSQIKVWLEKELCELPGLFNRLPPKFFMWERNITSFEGITGIMENGLKQREE